MTNFWLIRFNAQDSIDISAFTIGCIIKEMWQFLRAQLKWIPCHISKCFLALVNQSESQNWSCYTNSLLHLSPWADLAALFDAWPRLYLLYRLYLTSPYPSARMRSKGYCTQYTCEVAMRDICHHEQIWVSPSCACRLSFMTVFLWCIMEMDVLLLLTIMSSSF